MDVAHGHLNLGVAGDFLECGQVDSGHGHARQRSVPEVVEAKRRRDPAPAQSGVVGFADFGHGLAYLSSPLLICPRTMSIIGTVVPTGI